MVAAADAGSSGSEKRSVKPRIAEMIVGALIAVACAAMAPAAGWEQRAPLPVPNGGFVAAALGGRIVIAGGTTWDGDTKRWLNQVWSYDPATDRWSEAGRLPAALAYPASAQVGDTLWWAGGSGGETTHRALWTLGGDLAPRLVSRLTEGFVYAAAATVGLELHVVGGTDDQAALDRVSRRFRSIDLKTGRITPTHRDDLRFYALIETLRSRQAPRRLASYSLDAARLDDEDVTEGVSGPRVDPMNPSAGGAK